MRRALLILCSLSTALVSAEVALAETTSGPYYNPANPASATGLTIGSELYPTIGCPGRALLEKGCDKAPLATTATTATTARIQTLPPEPVKVSRRDAPASQSSVPQNDVKPEECYTRFIDTAASGFRDAFNSFVKTANNASEKTR